ncbi:ABC transporter ATP-binding protein [Ottowia thiooxydans]|uniref:ABC transporter ATP-binding protein n=1 Tax=Ottowia thiooxydans TaxID=219182 RepID=UPI0003FFB74B|nr:ABC transporter ATP-binding protein [Ottowia thiooxydans]
MSQPLLEAKGLTVQFGGLKAVDGVDFTVRQGEVFSLIGPNGAGKTTTFNLISGLYRATAGEIRLNGELISRLPAHRIAGLGVARTFQNIELFEHATVLQNLLIGCHTQRRSRMWQDALFTRTARRRELEFRTQVEQVIDFLDLQHYRDMLVDGLPYGVRKVVELGRALAMKPHLLLLDEPSSGLNPEETEDMAYWIEDIRDDLGITVVMVEHDMSLVSRVSDRVLALNYGRVLATGTAAEVQSNASVIEAYLGGPEE